MEYLAPHFRGELALHLSGGVDSLAALYMYRDAWDEILVCWVNTGAAYASVVEYMHRIAEMVPHFWEIRTNQPANIAENGYPADVMPMRATPIGRRDFKGEFPKIQSVFACCAANIWLPLMNAMRQRGIKTVIRGQRREEQRTGPISDGSVDRYGMRYELPIEDWTKANVFAYLREVGAEIPPYYAEGERTSRDCWDCTAYLDENQERILALPQEMLTEVRRRLNLINAAVNSEMDPLRSLL